ncbi:hypothetical protein GGR57DRAFT_456062 [Xylariaceae sp. FL1272]|nr:hypothetical protein GGR57DRAFT_456062 [Xylariaceae sp. FL1272]
MADQISDPLDWDVDRVVRELCFSGHPAWVPLPERPPPEHLEASLRTQGMDGHTLLTYDDGIDLFKSLDIKTPPRRAHLYPSTTHRRHRAS